ncbi:MAG: hypothetical protein AAGC73_09265 [Verrucomicrobiota bacterium]
MRETEYPDAAMSTYLSFSRLRRAGRCFFDRVASLLMNIEKIAELSPQEATAYLEADKTISSIA